MSGAMSDSDRGTVPWTLGLLDLPIELHMEIFLTLFNQQSVFAFRLTCRSLENVYQRIATTIRVDQRERIIAPIRSYLEFLAHLKLPEGSLRYPPAGGWPHIAPALGNEFEAKTPFAVDILRHLPYVHAEDWSQDVTILPGSTMEDYSERRAEPDELENQTYDRLYTNKTPPSTRDHVLLFSDETTYGGLTIFIDTLTGLVHEWEEVVPVIPVRDYFENQINVLLRFDEIFIPGHDVIFRCEGRYRRFNGEPRNPEEWYRDLVQDDDMYDAEEMKEMGEYVGQEGEPFGQLEDVNWVRHLHFKHGWPGETWDKEACLKEVREYFLRRYHQMSP